jgi:hypothetical protein
MVEVGRLSASQESLVVTGKPSRKWCIQLETTLCPGDQWLHANCLLVLLLPAFDTALVQEG